MNFKNIFSIPTVYAHCDIPCGIYDPTALQIASHTVLRMTVLLDEFKDTHDVARIVHTKEEHGATVEKELMTLKNDYFKPEHFEKFPELKDLIKATVMLSVKTRQKKDLDLAKELVENSLKISEIFYKSKDFTPVRVPSGFPTEGELVTHK